MRETPQARAHGDADRTSRLSLSAGAPRRTDRDGAAMSRLARPVAVGVGAPRVAGGCLLVPLLLLGSALPPAASARGRPRAGRDPCGDESGALAALPALRLAPPGATGGDTQAARASDPSTARTRSLRPGMPPPTTWPAPRRVTTRRSGHTGNPYNKERSRPHRALRRRLATRRHDPSARVPAGRHARRIRASALLDGR